MVKLNWKLLSRMIGQRQEKSPEVKFEMPKMLPGVTPSSGLAMDANHNDIFAYLNSSTCSLETFPGFAYLAQLMQLPEYRMLSEKTADAMVRKWIKFTTKGDGDKHDRIAKITDEFARFKVRELFRDAAKLDGFFGRGQIFFNLGQIDGDELLTPLIGEAKIRPGTLQCMTVVEPMYTYPAKYNSSNPLDPTFYVPQAWYVMGQEVHASRLMTFISKPVANILKPAYSFCGMSVSQLCRTYVDNWKGTVRSVNRMINNYSKSGIKTNLGDALAGSDDGTTDGGVVDRMQLYTEISENEGLMILHNGGGTPAQAEEFFQHNTPLTTLDKLQAQAQEHMASVANTPISVLLGITPAGLNASTDGEIRIWHERILDMQEILFRANLTTTLELIQLNMDGKIDPDIGFEFLPLWEMDEKEAADIRKIDAEAAQIYATIIGAISPDEVREKLANNPESGYMGLSGPAPEVEEPEEDNADAPANKG